MTCLYSFRNKYGDVCGCRPLGLTSLARRDDGCGPAAAVVTKTSGNLGRFVPVIRAHLLDAPQLQADPPFAFGEIGGAFAIFAARPKRHAVGLTRRSHTRCAPRIRRRAAAAHCWQFRWQWLGARRYPRPRSAAFATDDRAVI